MNRPIRPATRLAAPQLATWRSSAVLLLVVAAIELVAAEVVDVVVVDELTLSAALLVHVQLEGTV